MKMILAIIRKKRINETKKALEAIGLPSFMATGEVLGRGKGRGLGETYQQTLSDPEVLEYLEDVGHYQLKAKRMITLIVQDKKCDEAVQTIIKANSTGNSGDGKIFVLPTSEAIQIRTGDKGEAILD